MRINLILNLILAGLFLTEAFGTKASAQTTTQYSNGIGYRKYIKSGPNTNGEYVLRLETFLTNAANTTVPTDYILVLDGSKYMLYDHWSSSTDYPNAITKETNDGRNSLGPMKLVKDAPGDNDAFGGYSHYDYTYVYDRGNMEVDMSSYYDSGLTSVHIGPDGVFPYRTSADAGSNPTRYSMSRWFWVSSDKTYYHIYHKHVSSKNYLYYYRTNSTTSTENNKERYLSGQDPENTNTDADKVYGSNNLRKILMISSGGSNDKIYRPVQRREVMIGAVENFINTLKNKGGTHRVAMVAFSDEYDSSTSSTAPTAAVNNKTKVILNFTAVNSSSAASTFTNAINNHMQFRGTGYIDRGMEKAKLLLANNESGDYAPEKDGEINRQKVVIVFSAGGITNYSAAASTATTIKNTHKAKIYTVSMMDSGASNLHSLSSGNSYQSNFNYSATQPHLSTLFANVVTNSLSEGVSTKIAQKNLYYMKDVLSDYFAFANSTVTVKTAACTGGSSGSETFSTTENNPSSDVTASISGKTVTVSGFKFGTNWCGLSSNTAHGSKLIVEVNIKPLTGGAGLATNNTSSSGVYNGSDNKKATYTSPTINLYPITLIIKKSGLRVGESASFTLQRKLRSSGSSGSYSDFSHFVITGISGTTPPEIRFLNLDPTYLYQVYETRWGWSYTGPTTNPVTVSANGTTADPVTVTISNTFSPPATPIQRGETKSSKAMHN